MPPEPRRLDLEARFPARHFLINVSGSFTFGFVAERAAIDPPLRRLLTSGFYTFSTFAYETQQLAEAGATGWPPANVIASVIVGFVAIQVGVANSPPLHRRILTLLMPFTTLAVPSGLL